MSFSVKFSKARSLYRKGQTPEAILIFLQLLAHFPKNAKVRSELIKIGKKNRHPTQHPTENLLRAVIQKHKNGQVQKAYQEAHTLSQRFPNSSITSNVYGSICAKLNLLPQAETALKRSLFLDPTNPDVCNNLGNVYRELKKLDTAIFYYRLAVIFDPKMTSAHLNLGNTFAEKKMFDEARDSFSAAIKSNPKSGSAYRYLSLHTKFEKGASIIQEVSSLLEAGDLDDFNQSELFFAYAKMCEDTLDYSSAFEALKSGGALKQKVFAYHRSNDEEIFLSSKQLLEKLEAVSPVVEDTFSGPLPIFVVGMLRSGTSLVEQVISAHSTTRAGGELPTAELLCRKIFRADSQPTENDLGNFRTSYLSKVQQLSDSNLYLTDKMPQNFLHIGVLRKALPECKIVHVIRNAKATCWSNFRHCFQSRQMGFSFDLNDTIAYYGNYLNFMKSIEDRFGDEIYTLDYDLLCEDPRSEISSLLDYLKLPVEEACFNPHENEYIARTASQTQIQRPIYQGSSSAWKKYAEHIGAAFQAL